MSNENTIQGPEIIQKVWIAVASPALLDYMVLEGEVTQGLIQVEIEGKLHLVDTPKDKRFKTRVECVEELVKTLGTQLTRNKFEATKMQQAFDQYSSENTKDE